MQVKLRHPTFTDPDLIVGIAERTQLFKNEYTAELVARAAGFWDETETDRFIRTEQQLITGQRSQLAYENGLQMKLQKASAAAWPRAGAGAPRRCWSSCTPASLRAAGRSARAGESRCGCASRGHASGVPLRGAMEC